MAGTESSHETGFDGEAFMAKKNGAKKETRSDFLRKSLSKYPDLDLRQINRRWTKTGHSGEISTALFYQIRSKLGIKTQ